MSHWTHIIAAIDYDTFTMSDTLVEDVLGKLKDAPKITGSEGDAEVFVNQLGEHNVSMNCDCARCEYGSTIVRCEDGSFYCDAEEDYECPDGCYQTRVAITVLGDLRDRFESKTRSEWHDFLAFVEDMGGSIRNITCSIKG